MIKFLKIWLVMSLIIIGAGAYQYAKMANCVYYQSEEIEALKARLAMSPDKIHELTIKAAKYGWSAKASGRMTVTEMLDSLDRK